MAKAAGKRRGDDAGGDADDVTRADALAPAVGGAPVPLRPGVDAEDPDALHYDEPTDTGPTQRHDLAHADERDDVEALEMRLLLEAIHARYGLDFRDYAPASLKRRLWRRIALENLDSISGLQEKILHDQSVMERLLLDLSINVTSMFRDPGYWLALRDQVLPQLATWPFIRIWIAGCATGEEVYSLAILLHEAGLFERTRIYATDMNESVLEQARAGVFPMEKMREYTQNYIGAGGTRSFSEYYTAGYDGALFSRDLSDSVVFARHNLATDGSFNEFHLICCRNVLIYFDKPLQSRVHRLFYDSLARFGILALGPRESVRFMPHEHDYTTLDEQQRLYRRAV